MTGPVQAVLGARPGGRAAVAAIAAQLLIVTGGFAVHGTPSPVGIKRIEPHAYLDPFGQWRMSDTNEPVWPGEAGEPFSPGQYIDLQGRRRWSDTNQLVEQFPNRSQYQDDDGIWRWADTGEAVDDPGAGPIHGSSIPEAPSAIPLGFDDAGDFVAFGDDLYSRLRVAGCGDATAIFHGSSVTGRSFRTGTAFNVGRESDFDIALASPRLLERVSSGSDSDQAVPGRVP